MNGLPSGTVTMVFSDIEGSTLLLSRLGDAYARGARRPARGAAGGLVGARGGAEMGTEGDSFFVVFPTAGDAVAAAVQAQRELAAQHWPAGERLRVRIGIHTGSPMVHGDGYVGMDVHRAARIAGAAHGGQVVISEATAHLLTGSLPDGVRLLDLGAHRLKDLAQPERLFQLAGPGLQARFAPLKTLGGVSSLPLPPTPLVGRRTRAARADRVAAPAGCPAADVDRHRGLGQDPVGCRPRPRASRLVSRRCVLRAAVLGQHRPGDVDNHRRDTRRAARRAGPASASSTTSGIAVRCSCWTTSSRYPDAAAVVAELLAAGDQLVVLATSRRPLHVLGEHEHQVPPLQP